jgi:hypothetical protein
MAFYYPAAQLQPGSNANPVSSGSAEAIELPQRHSSES